MAKEKKIGINFLPLKIGKDKLYAIYCRVTYDRKSTRFSTNISFKSSSDEKAKAYIENLLNSSTPTILLEYKTWTEKLVRYEINEYKGDYSIIGLGDRINLYKNNLTEILIHIVREQFFKQLERSLTYATYMDMRTFLGNYSSIKYLIKIYEGIEVADRNVTSDIIDILGIVFLENLWAITNYYMLGQRIAHVNAGDWVVNQNNIKEKVEEIASQSNVTDLLQQNSNENFKSLLDKLGVLNFDYSIVIQRIDTLIEEYLQ